jgi:hypothetical protein
MVEFEIFGFLEIGARSPAASARLVASCGPVVPSRQGCQVAGLARLSLLSLSRPIWRQL